MSFLVAGRVQDQGCEGRRPGQGLWYPIDMALVVLLTSLERVAAPFFLVMCLQTFLTEEIG